MKFRKILSVITLVSLVFAMCVPTYAARHTVDDFETETIGDFVYEKDTNVIYGYAGNSTEITIPENTVVSKDFKFTSQGLPTDNEVGFVKAKKFIVSNGVTINGTLGLNTYNGFVEVEFYNTAEKMKDVDFYFAGNEKLKKLTLPNGLVKIQDGMCEGCISLADLYIPDSVKEIGKCAFQYCKNINELNLPKNLVEIGDKAFDGCNGIRKIFVPAKTELKSLYVPYELENAEFEGKPEYTADFYRTFLHTKWFENDVLPNLKDDFLKADGSVFRYIGNNKNVAVLDGTEIIEAEAFKQCDIESITFPDTLKEIKASAFAGCSKLKEVTIPKSVKMVEFAAFSECSSLEKIIIEGSPVMDDNVFEFCYALTDEGIIINGEIQYIVSVTGEKSIPFAFTNTSYNEGIFGIGDPELIETNNTDITPTSTSEPSETVMPEATANPEATAKPQPAETPAPKTLEVNGSDMSIRIDDNAVDFPDAQPFIDENGRTQIPLRAFSESIGKQIYWYEDTQTVCVSSVPEGTAAGGMNVWFTIGENRYRVNGDYYDMDTAAIIKDERTYIPVRFAAEAMGLTVEWVK